MSLHIEQSSFSIIVRNQADEITDRGTGFFINKDGYFITAGHVVEDPTCKYFALIGNAEHALDIKFKEYVKQDAYRSPVYMDLAFGKVAYQPQNFMKLGTKKLQPGNTVELNGFNKHVPASLARTIDELDELDIEENDRFFNSYATLIDSVPALKTNAVTKEHFIMNNVYTIEPVNQVIKGQSGGPITQNDVCYAIVNNAAECLTSIYIIDQLTSAGIEFTATDQ